MRYRAMILSLALAAGAFGQAKVRVAVTELRVSEGVSEAQAQTIREFLEGDLLATGKFEVVERGQIDQVLAEQGLQSTGCTETECAVEMGRILALKYIVIGSLSKLEGTYFLNAKIVDVESAKLVNIKRAQSPTLTGFNQASRLLAQELASGRQGGAVGAAAVGAAPAAGDLVEPNVAADPRWAEFTRLMDSILPGVDFKQNYRTLKEAKKILKGMRGLVRDDDRFFYYWHARLCERLGDACAAGRKEKAKFYKLAREDYRKSIKKGRHHATSKDAERRVAEVNKKIR